MDEKTKKFVLEIINNTIVIGLAGSIIFGSIFLVKKVSNKYFADDTTNKPPIVNVPDKTEWNDNVGGQEEPEKVDLITKPYTSRDVYQSKIYTADSIDVAVKGEFADAVLYIETNITNDTLNFLYLGFGTLNGTWGVDRLNSGQITYNPGSEFTKEDSSRSIDLMTEIKLSNTMRDVKTGLGGSKSKRLWDFIQPPANKNNGSVVNMVASLYDAEGTWGSEITKLQILYHCADTDPNCQIVVCPKGIPGSACLTNAFGPASAKNYTNIFNKKK